MAWSGCVLFAPPAVLFHKLTREITLGVFKLEELTWSENLFEFLEIFHLYFILPAFKLIDSFGSFLIFKICGLAVFFFRVWR